MKHNPLSKLHGDKRGAVLVEFAAAFLPLMITFSCFVQVAQLATAKLVVKHSAVVGARAAAVLTNAKGNTPDQKKGENNADVTAGVRAAMGPWAKTMDSVDVTIKDESSCDDNGQYGLVSVTVKAKYRCSVPFGSRLLCGAFHATRNLEQTYGFPHQGARYKGDGGTCGGGGGAASGGGGSFGGGGASGSF